VQPQFEHRGIVVDAHYATRTALYSQDPEVELPRAQIEQVGVLEEHVPQEVGEDALEMSARTIGVPDPCLTRPLDDPPLSWVGEHRWRGYRFWAP